MKYLNIIILSFICLVLGGCEDNEPVSFDYDFSNLSARCLHIEWTITDEIRVVIPKANRNSFGRLYIQSSESPNWKDILELEFDSGNISKTILSKYELIVEDEVVTGDLVIRYIIPCTLVNIRYRVKLRTTEGLFVQTYTGNYGYYRCKLPADWTKSNYDK
ncbi:MAG: hypothetical protein K2O24_04420 [Muribaculaceae bacterium]|nr:hypothetical protein [Muribaculaceae bacterium]